MKKIKRKKLVEIAHLIHQLHRVGDSFGERFGAKLITYMALMRLLNIVDGVPTNDGLGKQTVIYLRRLDGRMEAAGFGMYDDNDARRHIRRAIKIIKIEK